MYNRITQLISDAMFYMLRSNSGAGRLGLILKTTRKISGFNKPKSVVDTSKDLWSREILSRRATETEY